MIDIAMQRLDSLPDRAGSSERQDVGFIGRSAAIRGIDDEIDRAARSEASALVTGEAAVGRALVARLIHRRSARAFASMVTLNCAGLPDWLFESELFGHLRGSFPGAFRDKPGLLEMATGGTLLLDEVGELGPRMQARLLRFLDSGDVQRVGAERSLLRVDVRVVAASSLDLQARVDSAAFREDLYDRLSAIRITLPPLCATARKTSCCSSSGRHGDWPPITGNRRL